MYTTSVKHYLGTGRRKSSIARVRLYEGSGQVTVNGRDLEDYFTEMKDRSAVVGPLQITELLNRVNVIVNVRGGGITGQAGAASQGVARAIKQMFGIGKSTDGVETESEGSGIAKKLRDSGFLTRDSRMKERKKYGKKGARKSFQFSKR